MRIFAEEYGVKDYYGEGKGGICHVVMPEDGLVAPGEVIIGADSHTCTNGGVGCFATGVGTTDLAAVLATGLVWLRVPETVKVMFTGRPSEVVTPKDMVLKLVSILTVGGANYDVLEFHDNTEDGIFMEGRLTIANMAIECGAKAGVFVPDEITERFVSSRVTRPYTAVVPDAQATYKAEIEIDTSALEPLVAKPFSPDNVVTVRELEPERIAVDQVFVGSCTNGRIGDLRAVAKVFSAAPDEAVKVHRTVIVPGDQKVFLAALEEGLAAQFVIRGAVFSTPTCGPCLGGHMGVLAAEETALSTSNRNFRGRMGHPDSRVYLASPIVAAHTALKGYICGP
ncbi:MAG: 3-isopropylmalate dehydratase large subunit [Proteobacteria bacterium]|nr:3-isopropylmalate dehydratase large subunit [Pseudomonadota bacterium]